MAQNAEINFVRDLCGGGAVALDVDFLAGVRWFRFQDGFVFGAERGTDGHRLCQRWLYLNDHITNDLVGLQTGFNASYRFADCWKAFVPPEFGIYDNHMTLDYNLYAVSPQQVSSIRASSRLTPTRTTPCMPRPTAFPS